MMCLSMTSPAVVMLVLRASNLSESLPGSSPSLLGDESRPSVGASMTASDGLQSGRNFRALDSGLRGKVNFWRKTSNSLGA